MATQTTSLKQEAVDSVVARLHGRLSGARAEGAEQFIRHYYEDIAAEDIVGGDPEDLYGGALSLWQFAAQRKPGEAKIRALNPRVEKHGWHSPHTVLEIVNDDMPFLVDSVTMALNRRDLTVHLVVHPQFLAERDQKGKALSLKPRGDAGNGAIPESCMHIEIDEQGAPDLLRAIEAELSDVLADVRATVSGWRPMLDHVEGLVGEFTKTPPKTVSEEETGETIAFLQWLLADNFTFLGYREMDLEGKGQKARVLVREGSGLGVLRDPSVLVFQGLRQLGHLPGEVHHRLWQYCVHGGPGNARNFVAYAAELVGHQIDWREPAPVLRAGLYWPGAAQPGLATLRAEWRAGQPVAAIVFYRALLQASNLAPVDGLIAALEKHFSQ